MLFVSYTGYYLWHAIDLKMIKNEIKAKALGSLSDKYSSIATLSENVAFFTANNNQSTFLNFYSSIFKKSAFETMQHHHVVCAGYSYLSSEIKLA